MYPSGPAGSQCGVSGRAQVEIVRDAVFPTVISSQVVVRRSFLRSAVPFFTEVLLRLLALFFPEKFPDRGRCSLKTVASSCLPLRAEVIEYGF